MNILIVTANGREHALANAYAKSKRVKKVVMTPGNGLTDFGNRSTSSGRSPKIKNYPDVGMWDFDKIVEVCKKEKIDLVDVSQDDIIGAGYVDKFRELGISAFGPTKKASEIEWSKDWARNFMKKYKLPIPHFKSFSNHKNAIRYVDSLPKQVLFIKASGLIGGKGAIRAEGKDEAIAAIKQMSQMGKAGETFLIEECMMGEEFSLFAICDGKDYVIAKAAQDHKTAYDRDQGPNTGGMGCVAPPLVVTPKVIKEVEKKILKPFMKGMEKEGRPYCGILYLGGMLTKQGVKIIEFNARWGDPEAEVVIPSIQTDYVDIVEAVLDKKLNKLKIKFDNKVRVSVAGCSMEYPGDYSKVTGKEIFGLLKAAKLTGVTIFGAGITRKGKRFFANGGRVFHLVAEGNDILEARKKAYGAMNLISIDGYNLHYRTDIGWRDVKRLKAKL